MKRRLSYTFLFLIVTLCSFAQSKPVIKVDMSFAGRQDQEVLEPGYVNWATGTNRKDAETTIEGISFKFTTEDDKIFRNDWSKNYIQNADYKAKNGRLTFDCILLDPMTDEGTLLLSIKGLPAGQHTLQTYHNCKDNPASVDVRAMNVFVNGNLVCENLKPTIGEAVAANTTISVVSFNVASEEATTVIRYTTKGIADPITSKATIVRSPIICGFELNTVNIQEQAKDPLPASGDMHTDCDGGSCVLQWQSASDKIVAHNLYLGTDSATVADMTTPTAANLTAPNYLATSLSTHNVYYWRVDEISSSGNVTKGNVWSFRPRRLAFPEAEGYGRFAIGGRGGAVYHVTNLNHDHQPGSLLYGLVDMEGPRTIVFDVSGVIAMDFGSVFVDPNVTIAAHTAPGKGICLKHSNLNIGSDNICRFLRARRGYGDTGNAMGITGSDHAIIDHTSALWGTDETFSSRGAKNITFQYSMIAEALGIADHKNYDSGKNHGFAATIGGETGTFSHNYLVDCQGRNWSLGGGLDGAGYYAGRLDIFNNVVYNWGGRATDGGAHEVNFVGNYYKVGPANGTKTLLNAQLEGVGKGSQSYYVNGNIRQEINNGSLTSDKQGSTYKYSLSGGQVLDWEVWVDKPFFPSYATIHKAEDAYKIVVSSAGAIMPCRDEQHQRMQTETINASYTYVGSRSGIKGQIDHENDCGGWEEFLEEHRAADWDTDQDGIPNWFEAIVGTNPDVANNNDYTDPNGYTQLEEYLDFIAHPYMVLKYGEKSATMDVAQEFRGFTKSPVFTAQTDSPLFSVSMEGTTLIVRPGTVSGVGSVIVTCTDAEGSTFSQRFCVAVNGDPSGIRDVKPTDLQPKQQQIYNLKGQKVNSFYRGIMVKNGKKIMPF